MVRGPKKVENHWSNLSNGGSSTNIREKHLDKLRLRTNNSFDWIYIAAGERYYRFGLKYQIFSKCVYGYSV